MSSLPKKCVIDTNVPIIANSALRPDEIKDELTDCVLICVEVIDHVVHKGGLVIDAGDEVFSEYLDHLSLSGRPGMGDKFMKWVHDNRFKLPLVDRVVITKKGNSYDEFPDHDGLRHFDRSDRKFVAVANAHHDKPPILQATDTKWWGWKDALEGLGITVRFLCQDYAQAKYEEKMRK